jgi:hypothetical protein
MARDVAAHCRRRSQGRRGPAPAIQLLLSAGGVPARSARWHWRRWCGWASPTWRCICITTTSSATLFIEKVSEYCRRLTGDHGFFASRTAAPSSDSSTATGRWTTRARTASGAASTARSPCCAISAATPTSPCLRSLPDPGARCEPDLLVHEQSRQSSAVLRSRNRSHRRRRQQGDLLMITGPLGLRFGGRLMPRLETGEIAGYDLPTPSRVRRGSILRPPSASDLFLKLYTHGAQEGIRTAAPRRARQSFPLACGRSGRRGIEIHWATAWQMYQAADALIHDRAPASNTSVSIAGACR